MTRPDDYTEPDGTLTDPNVMLYVALGLADGHLHQADLALVNGHAHLGHRETGLTLSLKHMSTAAGWLKSAAEITAKTGRLNALLA